MLMHQAWNGQWVSSTQTTGSPEEVPLGKSRSQNQKSSVWIPDRQEQQVCRVGGLQWGDQQFFFYKGPDNKYFKIFFHTHSPLPLQCKRSHWQYKQWVWLCSDKTLFTKTGAPWARVCQPLNLQFSSICLLIHLYPESFQGLAYRRDLIMVEWVS